MFMKKICLFFVSVFFISGVQAQTKTYKGAWFDIKYPSAFKAKGSQKSSSADGYESATFQSPDKLVEFYVFSPQWSGYPSDIDLKPGEKLLSSKSDTSGSVITRWWTISANDKSYTRSYQEQKNEDMNVNWVIGIKYKDQQAYNKYRTRYAAFKASLVQYAD